MNICIMFLLILLTGCSAFKEESRGNRYSPDSPKIEKKYENYQLMLLDIHNKKRESYGIERLEIDKNLCEYAQAHANEMAEKESMYHSKISNLKKFGCTIFGENVAWGQETEESVVSAWMWSPGHRWNILGKSYTKAGFGLSKGVDGSNYWCVVFSN